jgi:ssDNA thymidine ADP-ribosyltransferase, DarT
MSVPERPKIYHIVHVDRLASIIADEVLWSDAEVQRRSPPGTTIGMSAIKQRRLNELFLTSHPLLTVGQCVPFYFCPRSIMLYLIHRANDQELSYQGGQEPIIHLETDLHATVGWAESEQKRWAFTLSNAGSYYFEDRCNLEQLDEVNWNAVSATQWSGAGIPPTVKEGKQAEFLVEDYFPWTLVERIGVRSQRVYQIVSNQLSGREHRPRVELRPEWYY